MERFIRPNEKCDCEQYTSLGIPVVIGTKCVITECHVFKEIEYAKLRRAVQCAAIQCSAIAPFTEDQLDAWVDIMYNFLLP